MFDNIKSILISTIQHLHINIKIAIFGICLLLFLRFSLKIWGILLLVIAAMIFYILFMLKINNSETQKAVEPPTAATRVK